MPQVYSPSGRVIFKTMKILLSRNNLFTMASILGIIPIKFTKQTRAHMYKVKTLEIKEYKFTIQS